jgi:hypothetical protein
VCSVCSALRDPSAIALRQAATFPRPLSRYVAGRCALAATSPHVASAPAECRINRASWSPRPTLQPTTSPAPRSEDSASTASTPTAGHAQS